MTPDHQARTAADAIAKTAGKIARWVANVHALHLAPTVHYTRDRNPGQPTPVNPKVSRPGRTDPTLATIDNADRIVDQITTHIIQTADTVEDACRWRGYQPPDQHRTASGYLHPSMTGVHAARLAKAAKWLAGWVDHQWAIARDLDAGDVRDDYLTRESVHPAVVTLTDAVQDLQHVRRRWVQPTSTPRLCVCGCRRVADNGRQNDACRKRRQRAS